MRAANVRNLEPLPVWAGRSHPRNWLLVGLIASLALHALLCFFFYRTSFQPATPLGLEKRPPPTFKVKRTTGRGERGGRGQAEPRPDQCAAAGRPEVVR